VSIFLERSHETQGLVAEGNQAFGLQLAQRNLEVVVGRVVLSHAVELEAGELSDPQAGVTHQQQPTAPDVRCSRQSLTELSVNIGPESSRQQSWLSWEVGATKESTGQLRQ
jgi:hypothetical protein